MKYERDVKKMKVLTNAFTEWLWNFCLMLIFDPKGDEEWFNDLIENESCQSKPFFISKNLSFHGNWSLVWLSLFGIYQQSISTTHNVPPLKRGLRPYVRTYVFFDVSTVYTCKSEKLLILNNIQTFQFYLIV